DTRHGIGQYLVMSLFKLMRICRFFLGIPLLIPLFLLLRVVRNRWMRFAALDCGVLLIAILLQYSYGYPHYAAPAAPLLYILVTQGLRRLRHCRRAGEPVGNALPSAVLLAYAAYFVAVQVGDVSWYDADRYPSRGPFARQLAEADGSHVVFVR